MMNYSFLKKQPEIDQPLFHGLARLILSLSFFAIIIGTACAGGSEPWVEYEGGNGPGSNAHIVLISGDEEYRSEETLPQLGKILAQRHGFNCTVLFAINPETGNIKPNYNKNIPGTSKLKTADLMIIFTRFRNLPDDQMSPIDQYLRSGKPVMGLRTATHAFKFPEDSKWAHYSFDYSGKKEAWNGGFGRLVLGETWINHHGAHGKESTRGIIPENAEDHPITNGIEDGEIWGPTDVYGVRLPLPGDSQPLMRGQVLSGMKPDSKPVQGEKNDPMMPVAWLKSYQLPEGKKGTAFTTTMGASLDFKSDGLRRLLVNAVYHLLGKDVPEQANVDIVGTFEPTMFGFGKFQKGMKPSDFERDP